jgi:protein PsiE
MTSPPDPKHRPDQAEFHKTILNGLEYVWLIGITIATVLAAGHDVMHMVNAGKVTLADLLLLFIYLEVLAMVGHYFESGQLPVRFPLYIGMVALARYLILDMKAMDEWRVLAVSGAILILALAVLVVRFGHVRFPYLESERMRRKHRRRQQNKVTNDEDKD